jgi:hypothetical protein
MKQLTYALWLKSTADFSIDSGLVNVITAAFNGVSHSNRRFSFTDYPAAYSSDIQGLADMLFDWGFPITNGSFISLIEFGFVRTYIANICLPAYGEQSFVRLIIYGNEPIAQQFDVSGSDFVILTISVNSPNAVFLTGSNPILRNWDNFNPVPLAFLGSTGGPSWNLSIPLLRGEVLEFKLVNGYGQYEAGPNRNYTAGDVDDHLFIDLVH